MRKLLKLWNILYIFENVKFLLHLLMMVFELMEYISVLTFYDDTAFQAINALLCKQISVKQNIGILEEVCLLMSNSLPVRLHLITFC